jgi:hypothetical protein
MATAARDRLGRTLRGDAQTAFSVELTARTDDLSLEVEGFGRVKFPVTPAKARKLADLGRPARFGRGEETVTAWPLAKERRQHVHSRIDPAELPATHVTRRQGRPTRSS